MNKLSNDISNWLSDDSIIKASEDQLEETPEQSYNVNNVNVKLKETVELFYFLKDIILKLINDETFENLPVPTQTNIYNHIKTMYNQRTNPNQVSLHIQNLYYHAVVSRLDKKLDSFYNYRETLKDVSNLKRSYTRILNNVDELEKKAKSIDRNYNKSIEYIDLLKTNHEEIEKKHHEISNLLKTSIKINEDTKDYKQQIANSKENILAFDDNIEDYKDQISNAIDDVNKIKKTFEEQSNTVKDLIDSAKDALRLKSSEGVSAALIEQYDIENDLKKSIFWIMSAIIFFLIGLGGASLLIFHIDYGFIKTINGGINSTLARIAFIGISIAAATFCAKQYSRQRRIADDYAYKSVLAKSILAFAEEIKKHDEDQDSGKRTNDYIGKVVNEITKSPVYVSETENITKKVNDEQNNKKT